MLDLFKSAPPVAAAEIRRAPSGCLRLTSVAVSGRTVTASGRERDLFEHSFVLQVRGAGGRVLASRPQTGDPWRDRLRVCRRHAVRQARHARGGRRSRPATGRSCASCRSACAL